MAPLLDWDRRPDGLRAPALVCAFRGWSDAGEASSTAVSFLIQAFGARRFAQLNCEEFFDFQAQRPQIKLVEGRIRDISWPAIELYEARIPRAPRDLVIVLGTEPAFRWPSLCSTLVELCESLGTQLVVTLGALLADVAHSQPAPITGVASDEFLLDRLGVSPPNYEGPTGIVGALHASAARAGLPAVSLWAAVPHYIAATQNPKAALALVRKFESLVGVSVAAAELEDAALAFERRVSRAVENDPDVKEFVERLERIAEEEESPQMFDPAEIPTGDVLAREFQRFLRQQGD